jgi:hypothetical protein
MYQFAEENPALARVVLKCKGLEEFLTGLDDVRMYVPAFTRGVDSKHADMALTISDSLCTHVKNHIETAKDVKKHGLTYEDLQPVRR